MAEKKSQKSVKRFNILVIDNSPVDIGRFRDVLRSSRYKIIFEKTSTAGIERMKNQPFDLVLLDKKMQGTDGFKIFEKILKNRDLKEIPVVFLSHANVPADIERAFSQGAWDYIVKSSDSAVIRAQVKNVLLRSQERKQDKEKIADLSARKERSIPAIKEKLEHIRDNMYELKKGLSPNDVKADKIEAVVKALEEINTLIDDICGDQHPN